MRPCICFVPPVLVASTTSFVASLLLLAGLRKKSTALIYPWVIITLVEFFAGSVLFLFKLANYANAPISAGKIFAAVFYQLVSDPPNSTF